MTFIWTDEQSMSTTPASKSGLRVEPGLQPPRLTATSTKLAVFLFAGYSIALPVYCVLIALANAQRWSWLGWWIDLWRPVASWLQGIVPLFDNTAAVLNAKGVGYRIDIIYHFLAIGWVTGTIVFAVLLLALLRIPSNDWRTFARNYNRSYLALLFPAFVIIFCLASYWITFGFNLASENILYAYHRYDAALVGIGMMFIAALHSGFAALVCLGALIYGPKFPPSS